LFTGMFNETPFLPTRSLIENYDLLLAYMKKCRERALNCAQLIPSSQLLSELEKRVELEPLSFEAIISIVEERVGRLVHCELCREAFKEVYGVVATCEDAKKILIRQLAGWYIEILEALGHVKVKYAWRP